jgi:NAD+ synthase
MKLEKVQKFIKEEVNKAGYTHAVVGLSGGIDSTVVCYLTVAALGKDNVLGVRMPYRTSSNESMVYAQLVIDILGIKSKTISITNMVDSFIGALPDVDLIRKGNIMARSRMIILYDLSAYFRGLVIGTGNKTEELLGYTTLYGDSACGINPVGDFYKVQIYELARMLNVPKEIISRAPSADLWENQTDEGELGFTYENVDKLLYYLIDKKYTVQECIDEGFDEDFTLKVVKRIKQNTFKRVAPTIYYNNKNYDFVNNKNWLKEI